MVVRALIERADLTKSQKEILMFLSKLDSPSVHVGIDRTAEKLKLADRTVRRAFREFESMGVLQLVAMESHGRIPRVYRLNLDALKKAAAGGTNVRPQGGTNVTPERLGDKCPPLRGDKCPRINKDGSGIRENTPSQDKAGGVLRVIEGGGSQ